jgi:hypothetical protein
MAQPLSDLSVLVPYRPDGGWRDKAWAAIEPAWRELGVELVVESPGPGRNPGDFNHPRAINRARDRATRPLLCVADADTGFDREWPALAAAALADHPWVLPAEYWQMSQAQTRAARVGRLPAKDAQLDADWVGVGVSWSGLVFVTADAFDLVEGYDERWEWWGSDDAAFAITMGTLVAPAHRLMGRALHFWHPRQVEHHYGHERHQAQHELCKAYEAAAGDPALVSAVRWPDLGMGS